MYFCEVKQGQCTNRTDHSCWLCASDCCDAHSLPVEAEIGRYVCSGCYDLCMIARKQLLKKQREAKKKA